MYALYTGFCVWLVEGYQVSLKDELGILTAARYLTGCTQPYINPVGKEC